MFQPAPLARSEGFLVVFHSAYRALPAPEYTTVAPRQQSLQPYHTILTKYLMTNRARWDSTDGNVCVQTNMLRSAAQGGRGMGPGSQGPTGRLVVASPGAPPPPGYPKISILVAGPLGTPTGKGPF